MFTLKIRKKGSMLIENIVAIAMILMIISGICEASISLSKWHIIKNKEEEFERITYALEEEIKYNLSIDEIKHISNNNMILLNKEGILNLLLTKKLNNIESGDDIIISFEYINNNRMRVNINLSENYYGYSIKSERTFVKDSVMNEYYKKD